MTAIRVLQEVYGAQIAAEGSQHLEMFAQKMIGTIFVTYFSMLMTKSTLFHAFFFPVYPTTANGFRQ